MYILVCHLSVEIGEENNGYSLKENQCPGFIKFIVV